jgi:CrcB protein
MLQSLSTPLAVALGGSVGALARYYLSGIVGRSAGDTLAFLGTVTVNLAGCLLIGLLYAVVQRTTHLSLDAQRFLITGLLGSLTTFSTFALDSLILLQSGRFAAAAFNIGTNLLCGLLFVWLGTLAADFFLTDASAS